MLLAKSPPPTNPPSSAPALQKAQWTPETWSNQCSPEANISSAPPPSTNIANTSKRSSSRASVPAGIRRRANGRRHVGILRGLRERYEVHHGVRIQDSALVSAAVLSNRYLTNRFLPDKPSTSSTRLRQNCGSNRLMPTEIDIVERRILQLKLNKSLLKKNTTTSVEASTICDELASSMQNVQHETTLGSEQAMRRSQPQKT